MLRTVAEETVMPDALTSRDEGTGSPSAMYSRTRAARIRLDRSEGTISTRDWRLLSEYYTHLRRNRPAWRVISVRHDGPVPAQLRAPPQSLPAARRGGDVHPQPALRHP